MLYEIRLHGRGGQGVVTAANLIAEAAVLEGLESQAIPFFGAERRGSPVVSYVRISDKPIRIHSKVEEPDIVIVFDEKLMSIVNVLEGLKDNGILVINSSRKPSELNLPKKVTVVTVNASSIVIKLGLVVAGWPLVNTAMLGAFSRVFKLISLEAFERAIRNHWSGKAAELNIKAMKEAYNNTTIGR